MKTAYVNVRAMTDTKIIDALGGTDAVASLCDVDKSTVSNWRKRGIPKGWRRWLQKTKPKAFKNGKVKQ